jgi:hypothetical protein
VDSLSRQGDRFYHQSHIHSSVLAGGEKALIGMEWAEDLVPRLHDFAEVVASVMSAEVSGKRIKSLQNQLKIAVENNQPVRLGVALELHEKITAGEIYLVFSTFAGARKDQLTIDLFWGNERDLEVIKK